MGSSPSKVPPKPTGRLASQTSLPKGGVDFLSASPQKAESGYGSLEGCSCSASSQSAVDGSSDFGKQHEANDSSAADTISVRTVCSECNNDTMPVDNAARGMH